MRLVDGGRAQPTDRIHFLALAARAMRFALVDYARSKSALRRGGGSEAIPLEDAQIAAAEPAASVLQLDEALSALAAADARLAQVVELRFFGGLSHDEVAAVIGRSVPTVKRDWTRARTWLYRAMAEQADG